MKQILRNVLGDFRQTDYVMAVLPSVNIEDGITHYNSNLSFQHGSLPTAGHSAGYGGISFMIQRPSFALHLLQKNMGAQNKGLQRSRRRRPAIWPATRVNKKGLPKHPFNFRSTAYHLQEFDISIMTRV